MLNRKERVVAKMDTIIGAETVIDGKIKSKASLRIEGKVLGEIISEGDITVGEQGQVECNIQARHISIAGKIIGNIKASGKIHIHPTGKLYGNCEMSAIIIEEGGILQGETVMKGKTEQNSEEGHLTQNNPNITNKKEVVNQ